MTTATIIGGGSFGTAMACVARRAGLRVMMWAREREVVESINGGAGNPYFLQGISVEPGITATWAKPSAPRISCSWRCHRNSCAASPSNAPGVATGYSGGVMLQRDRARQLRADA